MPRRTKHAGIHTVRDDRDRRSSDSAWEAWHAAWIAATKAPLCVHCEVTAFNAWQTAQRLRPEAPARDESLDGLHSRDAQKEVGDA